MTLAIQFVTRIIKPLEKLNIELTKQSSIDSGISDFITTAGNLAVQLSHFPETAGLSSLRSSTSCVEWEIIVHVADAWKHNFSDKNRDNKLSLGSQFEISADDKKYRFIRNAITIEHIKYGRLDFLKTIIAASQFILDKLDLNLIWKPDVIEATEVWNEGVNLEIEYANQIAWGGLRFETLRRNSEGRLVHSNGFTNMPFNLKQEIPIKATSYSDYIIQLINKSVPYGSEITYGETRSKDSEVFNYDLSVTIKNQDEKTHIIIKILTTAFDSIDFKKIQEIPAKMGFDKLFIFSPIEFSDEQKELASLSNDIYLLAIGKLDAHNIPIGFLNKSYIHSNVKLVELNNVSIGVLKEDENLFKRFNGKPVAELGNNFSIDGVNLISFITLCLNHVKPKKGKTEGKQAINYSPKGKTNIFLKVDDAFIKIGVKVEFEWKIEETKLPMSVLTYDRSIPGLSIWNLETYFKNNGEVIKVKIPVTKYGDTEALGML